MADRIKLCEQGFWGTLWAHAEMQTMTRNHEDVDENEREVGRVNKLMEANEVSKAASAVWGTGARVLASEVDA